MDNREHYSISPELCQIRDVSNIKSKSVLFERDKINGGTN